MAIVVLSPDVSVDFYHRALGVGADLYTAADGCVRRSLRIGGIKINLVQEGSRLPPALHAPVRGAGHFCVMTHAPLSDWISHLSDEGIKVEGRPICRTGLRGPMNSIFFRDPDRNLVEISRYE